MVLPVYNNSETLRSLTRQLVQVLEGTSSAFELIFIDDASQDNSASELDHLNDEYSKITVIKQSSNRGQHRTVLNGMNHAQGDHLIVMDADLQDQPSLIPSLMGAMAGDVDLVYLLRSGKYQSTMRMMTSYLFKNILFLISGLPPKAGSFFMVKRSIYTKMTSTKFHFPYISVLAHHFSSRSVYIEGLRKPNPQNRSGYSFLSRIKYALIAMLCKLELVIRRL